MDGECVLGIIDLCFRFMPFGVMISENRIVSPCTIGYNNSNLMMRWQKKRQSKRWWINGWGRNTAGYQNRRADC